jgi:hypothetical protein
MDNKTRAARTGARSGTMKPINWRLTDPRSPGSVRRLAEQKRQLERQLRADGWSKAAAVTEVSRRFQDDA